MRGPGPSSVAYLLLGVGAGVVEVARWVSRPVLATAGSVTRALAPPDWVTSVLEERGRQARAELEQAADTVLRWVLVRVVDTLVDTIDLTALVADNVDLDAVAAGLDVDAVIARANLDQVIARLDLEKIVQEVLDSVDIGSIVRESSETVASEALSGVRNQAMHADDAVSRLIDRLLRRGRDLAAPASPPLGPGESPSPDGRVPNSH
ncbi:hypothetical protein [Actinophytocola sp.]|uniref:hypothetical protein n=1 Tax=Actinophytocola sp. TaxID=1872138 RepID=UPI002D801447|nr:hypothetical protein [Actinophytocola sp.]HET9138999.1 hypothetical protein [Actinophytocola sp.]